MFAMKKYLPLLILCLALVVGLTSTKLTNAQGNNRAGLVIRFGDGRVETRCIEFSEQTISGLELLERSELPVLAAFDPSLGAMVCKIQDQGCPVDNCLCSSPPDYWSYWHLNGESWVYSPAGSSIYQVSDGEVQGWTWGPGNPPPVMTFEQVCAPPTTESPTNTPVPTNTPIPPTDTPMPTDTPIPTNTSELEATTEVPPTDTEVPPTQSDSQSQDTQLSTDTLVPSTETPLPTLTSTPSDISAPTNTPESTPSIAQTQDPYPYPPQPEAPVTNIPPTSSPAYPPAYPYPPVSTPDTGQTVITTTPTLVPTNTPTPDVAETENLLDQFYNAVINVRYPLLCVAWFFCGGSIALLLIGWVIILIRMR
jgi:hypothetical protein